MQAYTGGNERPHFVARVGDDGDERGLLRPKNVLIHGTGVKIRDYQPSPLM
jgi:hypothetical protein